MSTTSNLSGETATAACAPLPHVQPASTIVTNVRGMLTGATLDVQLQQVEAGKVNVAGGTMTGALILNTNPTLSLGAATKKYVDERKLTELADVNAGGIAAGDVLTYNGTTWIPQFVGISFPAYAPDSGPQYSFASNHQAGLKYVQGYDNRLTLIAPNAISLNATQSAVELIGGNTSGSDDTSLSYTMQGGNILAKGGIVTGTGASIVASTGLVQIGNGNLYAQSPAGSTPMTVAASVMQIEPSVYNASTNVLNAGGLTFAVATPTRIDGGSTKSGSFNFSSAPADTVEPFTIVHGRPTGFAHGSQKQELTAFGEIKLNSNPGAIGDVLTSAGPNQPATWAPLSISSNDAPVGVYLLTGNSAGNLSGASYLDWTYAATLSSDEVSLTDTGWTASTEGTYEIMVAMSAEPVSGFWPDGPVVYGTQALNATPNHDQTSHSSAGGSGAASFVQLGTGQHQNRKWVDRFVVNTAVTGPNFNVSAYGISYQGDAVALNFSAEVTVRRISPILS